MLYSGRNDAGAAAIVSFHNFKKDYREKYEDLHNDLDMATILSDVDGVKEMSYEEYGKFLMSKINNTEGAHVAIDAVANFYEDILKCQRDRGIGCVESDINRAFGEHIHNFWFTYRPYILAMRKNGYPSLARLVEERAPIELAFIQEG